MKPARCVQLASALHPAVQISGAVSCAAVGLQVLAPPRIDAADVTPHAPSTDAEITSDYYYAHRRATDYHIPTPSPQRMA